MASTLKQKAAKRTERNRRRLKAMGNGRLRLSVHRSDKNISAQIIDDTQGITIAAASSVMVTLRISEAPRLPKLAPTKVRCVFAVSPKSNSSPNVISS